jgi:hypothetical protein
MEEISFLPTLLNITSAIQLSKIASFEVATKNMRKRKMKLLVLDK